jgi:LysM domain protein
MREVMKMRKCLSLLAIALVLFMGNAMFFGPSLEIDTDNVKTVRVSSGDTLWTISQAALAETEDIDIREYIDSIIELNHFQNQRVLRAGERIVIPTLKEKTMFGFITAWAKN